MDRKYSLQTVSVRNTWYYFLFLRHSKYQNRHNRPTDIMTHAIKYGHTDLTLKLLKPSIADFFHV